MMLEGVEGARGLSPKDKKLATEEEMKRNRDLRLFLIAPERIA